MEISMLTMGGIVMASGYIVITLTTPHINEQGEEEYSLPGRILLAGADAIKWVYDKMVGWIGYLIGGEKQNDNVVLFNPPSIVEGEPVDFIRAVDEYEIVV